MTDAVKENALTETLDGKSRGLEKKSVFGKRLRFTTEILGVYNIKYVQEAGRARWSTSGCPRILRALVLKFDSRRGEILSICPKNAEKGSTAESP